MAKLTRSFSAKGVLTVADMQITETKKEEVNVYDLNDFLKKFDGCNVSFAVKEETEPTPVEHEGE